MPKIQNWSRERGEEERLSHVAYMWRNDMTGEYVRVEKFEGRPYEVWFSENARSPILKTEDRDKARKRAVRWMRRNPMRIK